MRREATLFAAGLLGLCVIAAGCSRRQLYDAGTGWRQQECNRMIDPAERARCMETANKDYDAYRKEKGADPK